jgi:hypothetical protein
VGLVTICIHTESYFLAAVFMYDVNFKDSLLSLFTNSGYSEICWYLKASKQNIKEHSVHRNKGLSLLFPEMKMH